MSRIQCPSCNGSGEGHGKDRYGEPNPCDVCNGEATILAPADASRTIMVGAYDEAHTVPYLLTGDCLLHNNVADAKVEVAPHYGNPPTADMDKFFKLPGPKLIVLFQPYAKGAAGVSVISSGGSWIDPHAEERQRLHARITTFRETGK